MNSCDFVASTTAVACCLAANKTSDEIALLSSFFRLLGETLESWLTYKDICCSPTEHRSSSQNNEEL